VTVCACTPSGNTTLDPAIRFKTS